VLNKADLIPGHPDAAVLARRILGDPEHQPAGAVSISAKTGEGFDVLLKRIDEVLMLDPLEPCTFLFPISEGGPLHLLHEHARVLATRYSGESCEVDAEVPESIRRRLAEFVVKKKRKRK